MNTSSKVLVKSFLLNSNYDENGKTTLAQRVYNDEQVKVHFGVKFWLCVSSGCLDVREILKGVVGRDDDQVWKMSLKRQLKKRKYLLVLDDVWDGEDGPDGARHSNETVS
uniref:NB-ARC domain-containing protein n=1 Tax=Salix viminalis TaxID=40686 RepID=A0A6N2N9A6_SALVM